MFLFFLIGSLVKFKYPRYTAYIFMYCTTGCASCMGRDFTDLCLTGNNTALDEHASLRAFVFNPYYVLAYVFEAISLLLNMTEDVLANLVHPFCCSAA